MIKLKEVTIHKYRSFFEPQIFVVEDNITVLVGMNESGKTAALQALAKTNYFQEDDQFKVNLTPDYPRKELNKFKKRREDQLLIECQYEIENEYYQEIQGELQGARLNSKTFTQQQWYRAGEIFSGLKLEIDPPKASQDEADTSSAEAALTEE